MRWIRWRRKNGGQSAFVMRVLLFSVLFLVGMFAGTRFAFRISDAAQSELSDYLAAYVKLAGSGDRHSLRLLGSTFFSYLRYPLVLILLCDTLVGAVLIPAVMLLYAFSLACSISCFAVTFGIPGILTAVLLVGFRTLCTLPVMLIFAAETWRHSMERIGGSENLRRRPADGGAVRSAAVVLGVLLLAACADYLLIPGLTDYFLPKLLAL